MNYSRNSILYEINVQQIILNIKSIFLTDFLGIFHKIKNFSDKGETLEINNKRFIEELKESFFQNLKKYQNSIDSVKFKSIFIEVILFLILQ